MEYNKGREKVERIRSIDRTDDTRKRKYIFFYLSSKKSVVKLREK